MIQIFDLRRFSRRLEIAWDKPTDRSVCTLRTTAGKLLDAASHIEDSTRSQMSVGIPSAFVVHLDGFADIDFRVVNRRTEEEAMMKVQRMIEIFNC